MKEYPVIYFDPQHKSFNWARGLYFIVLVDGEDIYLTELTKEGQPDKNVDGELNVAVTAKKNCVDTKMVFRSDEVFEFTNKQ